MVTVFADAAETAVRVVTPGVCITSSVVLSTLVCIWMHSKDRTGMYCWILRHRFSLIFQLHHLELMALSEFQTWEPYSIQYGAPHQRRSDGGISVYIYPPRKKISLPEKKNYVTVVLLWPRTDSIWYNSLVGH